MPVASGCLSTWPWLLVSVIGDVIHLFSHKHRREEKNTVTNFQKDIRNIWRSEITVSIRGETEMTEGEVLTELLA